MSQKRINASNTNTTGLEAENKVFESLKTSKKFSAIQKYISKKRPSPWPEKYFARFKPESFQFIRTAPYPGRFSGNLETELKWALVILNEFAEEIEFFVQEKEKYIRSLLAADYESAKEFLDQIEAKTGVSIWLLEQRLLCKERTESEDAYRNYVGELTSAIAEPLLALLITPLAQKSEQGISPDLFRFLLTKCISSLEESNYTQAADYIWYKTGFYTFDRNINPAVVLYFESRSSFIDIYQTSIHLCKTCLTKTTIRQEVIRKFSSAIHSRFPSEDSASLVLATSVQFPKKSKENHSHAFDQVEVELQCAEALPTDSNFLLAQLQSNVSEVNNDDQEQSGSIASQILDCLKKLKLCEIEAKEAVSKLKDIANKLGLSNLSDQLSYLTEIESSSSFDSQKKVTCALSSSSRSPFFIYAIRNPSVAVSFLRSKSASYPLFCSIAESHFGFETEKAALLAAGSSNYVAQFWEGQSQYRSGNITSAIDSFRSVFDSEIKKDPPNWHVVSEVSRELFTCYLDVDDFFGCEDVFSKILFRNPRITDKLNLRGFITKLNKSAAHPVFSSIYIPILYYVEEIDPFDIYPGYDNFMFACGIKFPHELFDRTNEFPTDGLRFFLQCICTPDVLRNSPYIGGTEARDDERLKIVQFLSNENPDDREELEKEISEISMRRSVSHAVRQSDYSKIFVDVAGIKKKHDSSLKQQFLRFREIWNPDAPPEVFYSETSLLDSEDEQDNFLSQLSFFSVKSVPRGFKEFCQLMLFLRDEFVLSKEFGLNSYLSMRIRHITLQGQIRSGFEAANLLTTFSSDESAILPEVWINEFGVLNEHELEKLAEIFGELTNVVEEQIEVLNSDLIRITTERQKTEGLFDFSLQSDELIELYKNEFWEIESYDEFTTKVFDLMWARADEALITIRQHLDSRTRATLLDALNLALNRTENVVLTSEVRTAAIDSIVRSKAELQGNLTKVLEWFTLAKGKQIDKFDFGIVLEVAIARIRDIHPNYEFDPHIVNSINRKFRAFCLQPLVDLFSILFDNILEHSGLESPAIRVHSRADNERLCISVTNELSDEISLNDLLVRLGRIWDELADSGISSDRVVLEGESGYPKIRKILGVDLARSVSSVSFETESELGLAVEVEFEIEGLVYEDSVN